VGFRADLEVTELLFTSLLLQATTAMLATAHGPEGLRAFRHAFLLGYASSIGRRLYSAQERTVAAETQASGRSAELVLASREAVVGRMVDELFPRLGRLRSTASDRRGVVAGNRAGDAADLSTGRNQVGERRGALAPGAS
jgi:hypothetical protein